MSRPPGIRRVGIGFGIGLQSLAVAVLFLTLNAVSFEHFVRADYSRSQKFALAPQTKRVLRELKKPVEITVIASPTFASPVTQILGDVRNLMNELVFSGRDRIRVTSVDPTRDLTRMRELQAKYQFQNADGVMVFDYDGKHRIVALAEMADFDFRPLARGEAPILLAFRGEQVVTATLIGLLRPEDQTVYFLQGHGEPAPGPQGPLAVLTDYLGKQGLPAAPLALSSKDSVPSDAGAIVIVGARSDLDEREAAILRQWWEGKGRLLVLLDPEARTPRLQAFLEEAGIRPQDDRVLRLVDLPFATGILRTVTGEVLPTTEMTRRLAGINILFPGSTQSLALDEKLGAQAKIQLRRLIEPAEEFWGETAYAPNTPGGVKYEDGIDHGQPLTIAAMADRGGVADDRVEVQTARMIVVGSAQFLLDSEVKPPGLDFVLGAVNTLVDRARLAGVAPKTVAHFQLDLTQAQLGMLALFSMVVIPGGAALCGIVVWWRRRK